MVGRVGPQREKVGVPTASARYRGPVSQVSSRLADFIRAASSRKEVSPAMQMAPEALSGAFSFR